MLRWRVWFDWGAEGQLCIERSVLSAQVDYYGLRQNRLGTLRYLSDFRARIFIVFPVDNRSRPIRLKEKFQNIGRY